MERAKKGSPESHERSSHLALSALTVVLLSLASAQLLLSAFVMWLSIIIGSLSLSLLLTGSALGIAAWVTYRISLAEALKRLREEYQQFMTIVMVLRRGYDCAIERLIQLFSLLKS